MSFGDIRLRLVIRRHTVPDVKLVWPCSSSDDLTIAKLLGLVNEVVPLEGGEWGLEDYVVELGDGSNGSSFECLHFQLVSRILKDEDQVLIRPLLSDDLKRRRRSGRHQISNGGKHLVDGIAFGRPWLHLPGDRPALELPPRKRARITYGDQGDEDQDSDAESEFDADWDSNDEPEADDGEHANGSSFEDEQGDEDLMQELELLKKDRRDISEASSDNEDVGFGLLPMLDSMAALRMAFPNIPSFIIQQELRRQSQKIRDAYTKLAQSYGPSLSFDQMMDSVLTTSRPSNTPITTRLQSLGEDSPAQPPTGRRLIEVVESEGDDVVGEDPDLNESGKVIGLGIRDADVGLDSESEGGETSDSDSDSDSSGGTSYKQAKDVATENKNDDSDDSFSEFDSDSDSSSDSSSDSDSEDEVATARSRDPIEAFLSSDSDSDSSDSESSSSEDSDSGPMEISTSRIQTLSKAVIPPTPSVLVPAVNPGCGLSRTQKRNARRKRSKQIRSSASEGNSLHDSTPDEIMADLAARKAALLSSLGSDSLPSEIPESVPFDASLSEPPADQASTRTTNGVAELQTKGEAASASQRRLNLNTGASKRLLFGALGVKAPKSKADEEKIKQDLMKGVKPLANKRLVEEVEEAAQPDTAMEDDSWRDKISYRAVECCQEGIVLSQPPFPFVQRWDPQQQYNSSRKRKRHSHSQHYEDYEDNSLVFGTPAKTGSNKKMKSKKKNSDDQAETEMPNSHAGDAGPVEDLDLPPLPSDLTSLVSLEKDAVTPGQLITWKQLSMSKATGWQPQLASFTAVVLVGSDKDNIQVLLAKRDRETNDHVYDEHTGQRVYEKFEAPALDDEEEAEADDGHRTISWFEMMEPRQVPGSAPAGFVEMTNGALAIGEVSAEKSGHASTGHSETQQSAETHTSADGADSALLHSAQRQHHFELPLADDGLVSAASDSLDTGHAPGVRQQSHEEETVPARGSPGEGRRQQEAAADKVATGSLSGKPSLGNEADTATDAQEAAQPQATKTTTTAKGKKGKAKARAETKAAEDNDATTVIPSSLPDDVQNDVEDGVMDMEVGDSLARDDDDDDDLVIPETLLDAVAPLAPVPDLLNSSPFESLEDLFVTASSSRASKDEASSSLPVMPAPRASDAEYEEAIRRLDDVESDAGASRNLFPNATQPTTGPAAATTAPAARSSPRRQAKPTKTGWTLPEGSLVIALSSSPVQQRRQASPEAAPRRARPERAAVAASRRRSASAQVQAEEEREIEGSQQQRAKLRNRSSERRGG
ncbi:hypothetical protein ISF_07342 [Cordyceps fumosorosea ARSEF 2679]|uniref:DUF7357 domain-containing protein n=1 Tax=Cordyceps fumosorosea (strain ARSEF 2679) TaxID=1081104 RepID=A0A167PMM4_CORFA|nr:hypothetical protein ISF_07342 [Cordyceps fumosorosea ARSEF 2679]OAA56826.1 hypothetical protein ISF_07342 [Cordyceps fumosorosea ARSEF 2679]